MASTLDAQPAESTEEAPTQNPPAESPYGEFNQDLPKQIVDLVRETCKEFQGQNKFSRRREVRRDSRLRHYQEGHQHLLWTDGRGYSEIAAGSTVTGPTGESKQCPRYIDVYNIFLRFFLIIQAVLTQSLPGVKWKAIDPDSPEDLDKTKAAEDYSTLFDRWNDMKDILAQIARMMGMSGRTVSWTRTEADGQKFGYDAQGKEKRFQRTTIHGTLETKVPITCREFDKKTLYAMIYEDQDVKLARDAYPWIKDKIKEGASALGENTYERYARLGVLNGSRGQAQVGDTLSHIVSGVHVFLRPAAFSGPEYDVPMEEGGEGSARDFINELFPNGARFVFQGEEYAASFAECMDDHIDIRWPYQGDGMFRQGFMEVMVVVSDNFNDLCNWIREKVDTGAGSLWVNGDQNDVDAITSQRAAPNAVRPAKQFKPPNEPLGNGFFAEEDPQIPETVFKLLEFMRGDLPEFLLAALPSLQGGEMSDNNTASGYAQATANAKGQLGIIWQQITRMYARIRYQSAMAAAEEARRVGANGLVLVPGRKQGETVSVNMDALQKGDFGCYPDEDNGFPETTGQKRLLFKDWMAAAGQSPMAAQLLDNPDNIEQAKELIGFPELVFIPAEARTKQLFEIEALLQSAPIPPDPQIVQQAQIAHAAQSLAAGTTGGQAPPFTPPPDQPSAPVQELDYHQFEFEKCQEWLSSRARRDEEKKGNDAGIQNVILHALAHRVYIQQAAAAQSALAAPPAPSSKGVPSPPAEKKPTPGTQVPQAA